MAKKSVTRKTVSSSTFASRDISSWNFIIFLTLSLLLIVAVISVMGNTVDTLRTRAGLTCPDVSKSMPRPEDCPGGTWSYTRDGNGCPTFVCK